MYIDIEKAKKEFMQYTSNYDTNNERINLKIWHSLRVMEISNQIAKRMKLSEEDVEIATVIGLLHDIARFEQQKQYGTFRDVDSFDHGDYGVKILDKDIRKYVSSNQYDNIIKKAIKNHNKYEIEDGLNYRERFFAKLIRDADKIDIMYEAVEMFWKHEEDEMISSEIDKEVYEQIINNQQIKRREGVRYKYVDGMICIISFIYDINFKESFQIIDEENHINHMIERFDFKNKYTKAGMERIRETANEYIKQKGNEKINEQKTYNNRKAISCNGICEGFKNKYK